MNGSEPVAVLGLVEEEDSAVECPCQYGAYFGTATCFGYEVVDREYERYFEKASSV